MEEDVEMQSDVVIKREKYEYLLERDSILSALEAAGVDNCDGYEIALEGEE